jgi:hypothetical protein
VTCNRAFGLPLIAVELMTMPFAVTFWGVAVGHKDA